MPEGGWQTSLWLLTLCQPAFMVQLRACTTIWLTGTPLRASGSPPWSPLTFDLLGLLQAEFWADVFYLTFCSWSFPKDWNGETSQTPPYCSSFAMLLGIDHWEPPMGRPTQANENP
jgi:hypothetical protein